MVDALRHVIWDDPYAFLLIHPYLLVMLAHLPLTACCWLVADPPGCSCLMPAGSLG